jgi:succinoglycan biosynthesis transport protein ExoP
MPHIKRDESLTSAALPPPEILPPPAGFSDTAHEAPPSYYLQLVWRYRWQILTFVVLATTAAALVVFSMRQEYAATAILRIDPSGMRTVGQSSTADGGVPLNAESLITTEASELTSPAVILRTVDALKLYRLAEFNPTAAANPNPPSAAEALQVANTVKAGVSASNPSGTYLLNVSFRSYDPTLSANVANSLLQSLIQQDYQTRVAALMGASTNMRAQLVDLRSKMEAAQAALVQYESSHDVLNPDSSNNIMQASLTQVNQDLGVARSERITLQALNSVAQKGGLDALMATKQGAGLTPLYQQLLQDQTSLARMSQVYGPNFPVYREQEALVEHDRSVLQRQQQHIANQIQAQYAAARSREQLLEGALQTEKLQMDAFNRKAIRYQALKASADSYTKLYYELQQEIQDASVAANLKADNLRIISPAHPVETAVYPRRMLTVAATFLLSLFLGVGAAVAVGMLDPSLATAEQIENLFRLPLLTALPAVPAKHRVELQPLRYGNPLGRSGSDARDLPAVAATTSHYREAILGLSSTLRLTQERDLRTLAITSSLPGEGKSTAAANLAAALAVLDVRVVLVDADMRKPSVHRIFQVPNRLGLSALLRGKAGLDEVLLAAPGAPNLHLIPSGVLPASPAELLHVGLGSILEELQGRFDLVVFDCPPILGFADALAVTSVVDGCVLVVHAGKTDRQMVTGALRQLRAVRAEILGIVLNNVSEQVNYYYSYYSSYGEYKSEETLARED